MSVKILWLLLSKSTTWIPLVTFSLLIFCFKASLISWFSSLFVATASKKGKLEKEVVFINVCRLPLGLLVENLMKYGISESIFWELFSPIIKLVMSSSNFSFAASSELVSRELKPSPWDKLTLQSFWIKLCWTKNWINNKVNWIEKFTLIDHLLEASTLLVQLLVFRDSDALFSPPTDYTSFLGCIWWWWTRRIFSRWSL